VRDLRVPTCNDRGAQVEVHVVYVGHHLGLQALRVHLSVAEQRTASQWKSADVSVSQPISVQDTRRKEDFEIQLSGSGS